MATKAVAKPSKTKGSKNESLVKMVRNGQEADVHHDNIESFKRVGWQKID